MNFIHNSRKPCHIEIMEATTMLSKLENLSRDEFEDLCFWLGIPQASWPARLPPKDRTLALIDWLTERNRLPDLIDEMSYREQGLYPDLSPSSPSNC